MTDLRPAPPAGYGAFNSHMAEALRRSAPESSVSLIDALCATLQMWGTGVMTGYVSEDHTLACAHEWLTRHLAPVVLVHDAATIAGETADPSALASGAPCPEFFALPEVAAAEPTADVWIGLAFDRWFSQTTALDGGERLGDGKGETDLDHAYARARYDRAERRVHLSVTRDGLAALIEYADMFESVSRRYGNHTAAHSTRQLLERLREAEATFERAGSAE